jgi:hypothetical protein
MSIFCKKCGVENVNHASFCKNCGSKLEVEPNNKFDDVIFTIKIWLIKILIILWYVFPFGLLLYVSTHTSENTYLEENLTDPESIDENISYNDNSTFVQENNESYEIDSNISEEINETYIQPISATLPNNGEIKSFTNQDRIAQFEIESSNEENYLIKIKDYYSHKKIMTIFVRGGESIKTKVPLGEYEITYASGKIWYGYENLFGSETHYSKADEKFSFEKIDNKISGYTITLYPVIDGTLATEDINKSQF